MTGLDFDYELTETPQEVWESGAELIVGIPPNYAPPGAQIIATLSCFRNDPLF